MAPSPPTLGRPGQAVAPFDLASARPEMAPKPLTLTASRQSRGAARFRGVLAVSGGAVVGRGLEAGHVDSGRSERPADAIADPLRVPPLDRRDRHAVDQHLVVQVIAEREPGRTAASQLLALGHAVTELDRDRRKMSVERLQPEAA